MSTESDAIVIGVVVGIIALLIAASFIVILTAYSNTRKIKFFQEKKNMQLLFNEQLLKAQLEVQEQTFNMISQEIHDNVGQLLSLAKIQANMLEVSEGKNQPLLQDLQESLSKALGDLRDLAKSLNSERIEELALSELVRHELHRIERLGEIKTLIRVTGNEKSIGQQKKLILLRIAQECLQNILKHAGANTIETSFCYGDAALEVIIKDDGKGFDPGNINKGSGLGLQNIISRAQLIGGKAVIDSAANKGTAVSVVVPY